MITIQQAREILGPSAEGMTDAEVQERSRRAYVIVRGLFLNKLSRSKNPAARRFADRLRESDPPRGR